MGAGSGNNHFLSQTRGNGACGMYPGDRVVYSINGKHGVAKEFLQDGDAYVEFDDGSPGNVKWNHLSLETK